MHTYILRSFSTHITKYSFAKLPVRGDLLVLFRAPRHDHAVFELSAKGVFDAGPTSDLHGHITCESMGHWRVLQIRFRGIEP